MHEAPSLWLLPGAFLIGLTFGAVVQRSHFCTMGCISDAVLFGSLRRLRVWALAIAVALAGSQVLDWAGLVRLDRSLYRGPDPHWLALLPGGALFGFGMVLAGGCVSRNLVRVGGGSLKALTALATTGVVAAATWLVVPPPTTPSPVDGGAAPAPWSLPLGLVLAAALLLFCLRHPGFRRSREDLATGAVLGALVPLGWLATSLAGGQAESLNFLALDRPSFTVPLLVGTVLGAATAAGWRREFRVERFVAQGDLRRHLTGGALMGCGGALALGCTVGQGLAGVSTLAPSSILALAGMLGGGWWGIKYLETGRVLPPLPAVPGRRRPQLNVADAPD